MNKVNGFPQDRISQLKEVLAHKKHAHITSHQERLLIMSVKLEFENSLSLFTQL
jgi:hypothetical protein